MPIPFDDLKATVMTLVVYFSGSIDLYAACDLLEYVLDAEPLVPNCNRKKIEFKTHPNPGAIININFRGVNRGFAHSKNTKHFRNSIGIITSIKDKNLAIKLSSNKIHITGAKKIEHGDECANHIIRQLLEIQTQLDFIQANPDVSKLALSVILDLCKGPTIENTTELPEDFELLPEDKVRNDITEKITKMEKDTDAILKICNFYLRYYKFRQEFPTFNIYSQFLLKRASKILLIGTPDLKVIHIHKVMFNYNYDIGFDVKRSVLASLIQNLNNGFRVNYDNSLNHTVTVFLPYDPALKALPQEIQKIEDEKKQKKNQLDEEQKPRRKARKKNIKKKEDKKVPRHNFLVYKTGQITFSTNGIYESMKQAYDEFNQTMESLKEEIIQPTTRNREKKKSSISSVISSSAISST